MSPITPAAAYEACRVGLKHMAREFKRKYGLNEADTEDLEQDGCVAVLNHVHEFDESKGNTPWTFFQWPARTAMNEWVRKRQRSRTEQIPPPNYDSANDRSNNGHPVNREHIPEPVRKSREVAVEKLKEAFETAELTDTERQLVEAYSNGATLEELAANLKCDPSTVSRRRKKAAAKLSRSLSA